MDLEILHSTVRISTPLIFAALGGLLTYQAGMLNIALDGFMIVAAFAGVAVAYFSGSLVVAILAAVGASMLLAALMALFNIRFRAHIFIAGTAVTFLAYGLTALLLKGIFGQDALFTSDAIPTFPTIVVPVIAGIPVLGPIFSGHTILVYVAYLLVPVVAWALYRTRWGLRLRVVGEAPEAAATAGVNVDGVKFQAMLLSRPLLRARGRLSFARLCYAVLQGNDSRARADRPGRDLFRPRQSVPHGRGGAAVRRRDRSLGDAAASDRARAATLADDPLCGHRAGSRRGGMAIDAGSKQTPGLAFRSRLSRTLRASGAFIRVKHRTRPSRIAADHLDADGLRRKYAA